MTRAEIERMTIWAHKTASSHTEACFYPAAADDENDIIVISDVRKGDTVISLTLAEFRELAAAVDHHAE